MRSFKLKLKPDERSYRIVIGHNAIAQMARILRPLKLSKNAVVITHPKLKRLYGKKLTRALKKGGYAVRFLAVPEGEQSKSAQVAIRLLEKLAKTDAMKNSFIVAFGGGVIGDLAGFVAAVYKRGIDYIQVPTTFLAQIDSAIGGKVGVDLSVGKNLAGAFYHPRCVISDTATLKTLSRRQMRNGMAEAVKYGVISDPKLFRYLEKNHAGVLAAKPQPLTRVVRRCSRIKAGIVERDEKETKGLRTVLNFGHTFGHAIEAAGKYTLYQHGEAIGLGMRMAAEMSRELKHLNGKDAERINALISAVGLPKAVKQLKVLSIIKHMRHDKKFKAGKNRFVLAAGIGRVKVVEGVPADAITHSVKAYLK